MEESLVAVWDGFHQPVSCLDSVFGEHLIHASYFVLGHDHHPLSAAPVKESRSSAAGTSRAWRADRSRPGENRRRSGLVLTRLPKPCDAIRDRAEERAWRAGTQTLQESCARRA